jgi:nitrogen fixation NifU-like protein
MSMANDALSLYRAVVLEHSRRPRHRRVPAEFQREAQGHNALCGDKVHVYVCLSGELVSEVCWEGAGCAICLASASLMSEHLAANSPTQALRISREVEHALNNGGGLAGDLAALSGVHQYPARIRCATLPWRTLCAALDGTGTTTVSTE